VDGRRRTVRDAPDEVYTTYRRDGRDVAASYTMDAVQRSMGVPAAWLQYVCVEDVDVDAARAAELGATLLAEPFEVMEHGRMALIEDPAGALLALWEPLAHAGVGVRDEPGSLCWVELATRDMGRARDFYTGLFGWGTRPVEGSPMAYEAFTRGEEMVGGMFGITPGMGEMPSAWLPYFAVDDADATAARVRELGGEVLMEPEEIPGIGRFCFLQDPQGAKFYVIKLAPMPES
jgi:predicted enzyme related to lactoylglutathione lyase